MTLFSTHIQTLHDQEPLFKILYWQKTVNYFLTCWQQILIKLSNGSLSIHHLSHLLSQILKLFLVGIFQTSKLFHYYLWSKKLNSNMSFVIFAPLWPENTNILSLTTAKGKLQQVGGLSPDCCTWRLKRFRVCFNAMLIAIQDCIGFASLHLLIGLKIFCHPLQQSDGKVTNHKTNHKDLKSHTF